MCVGLNLATRTSTPFCHRDMCFYIEYRGIQKAGNYCNHWALSVFMDLRESIKIGQYISIPYLYLLGIDIPFQSKIYLWNSAFKAACERKQSGILPCLRFRINSPLVDECVAEYVCTGKWPEEQRNVERNNNEDDGDEPPVLSGGEGGSEDKASEHKGKVNPNTSKKRRGAGKRIEENCFWMPRWLPPTSSIPQISTC